MNINNFNKTYIYDKYTIKEYLYQYNSNYFLFYKWYINLIIIFKDLLYKRSQLIELLIKIHIFLYSIDLYDYNTISI